MHQEAWRGKDGFKFLYNLSRSDSKLLIWIQDISWDKGDNQNIEKLEIRMKVEKFFGSIFQEICGINPIRVHKHFKDFRKSYQKLPQLINSLDSDVTDSTGKVLSQNEILKLIDEMKQKKADSPGEFWQDLIQNQFLYTTRLLNLYIGEIETQLRFAKICYKDYLTASHLTV
jgi:hypothetical protein